MNDALEKFLFFGMTREQATGAYMFGYRVVVIFGLGAGWGWFSALGVPQFALAKDVETKIESMQSAVLTKLRQTEETQTKTVTLLNKQLASTVATQIRAMSQKRCGAQRSDEREAVNREIDRLQDEYYQYRLERYSTPACAEL
jgi:cell division protein FtsB